MTIITKGMGKILTNIFKPKMPKASSALENILKPKMPKATKGVIDRNISSKKMFKTMQELKNNRALKKVSQKNKNGKK
jgi:hypothetical protein